MTVKFELTREQKAFLKQAYQKSLDDIFLYQKLVSAKTESEAFLGSLWRDTCAATVILILAPLDDGSVIDALTLDQAVRAVAEIIGPERVKAVEEYTTAAESMG